MKLNVGKGLLRLYCFVYVFWVLIGLGYYHRALMPHVGIDYWTLKSYEARLNEDCDAKTLPADECSVLDIASISYVAGYPSDKDIASAPREFFGLFVALPIILLLVFSAAYKGLKWVVKGFIKNKNN